MKSSNHRQLFDAEDRRGFQCRCRAHPERLADQGTLTKEIVGTDDDKDGLLPCGGDHGNLHFAGLNKENRICAIALSKDFFTFRQPQDLLAL